MENTIDLRKEIGSEVATYVASLPAKIVDQDTYVLFSKELIDVKKRMKVIDDRLEPEKKKARAAYQSWIDLIDELKAPLKEREAYNKAEMTRWQDIQEKLRKEAEDKERARLIKEAEERQLADAIAAEEAAKQAGATPEQATEQAAAIMEEPLQVAPAVVQKAVPKVDGISYRTDWKYRIVDTNAIPRQYLMIDEKKIAAMVSALKNECRIAGVEVYSIQVVTARARG